MCCALQEEAAAKATAKAEGKLDEYLANASKRLAVHERQASLCADRAAVKAAPR